MTVEDLKEDKPAEYEALVKEGKPGESLVEPYPHLVIRVIRFFGWTALSIGFSIVIWIIYAMSFAHQ